MHNGDRHTRVNFLAMQISASFPHMPNAYTLLRPLQHEQKLSFPHPQTLLATETDSFCDASAFATGARLRVRNKTHPFELPGF
jgi:hypothetical protein